MNTIFTRNSASATLPFVRVACYGSATFLLGRKIYHLVGFLGCGIGSKLAGLMKYAEQEKNLKSACESFNDLLKDHFIRDLTMTAGLVVAGLAVEKVEDSLARVLANRNAGELIQASQKNIATAYKNGSMLAAKTYRDVLGDNRYPVERIRDGFAEISYAKNVLIEKLKINFRITRPYSAPIFKNAVEACGAVCQEKVMNSASEAKDQIVETSIRAKENSEKTFDSVVNVLDFTRFMHLLAERRESQR